MLGLFSTSNLLADRGNFLNYAILTIPPKFLADIPMNQRTVLLKECSLIENDQRLDYKNGYLDFYSDGGDVDASSMFYLKVLPIDSPFGTPVFIHMQKPFNGIKPSKDDTWILEQGADTDHWIDITDRVIPKGIDRASYFNPLRGSNDIEVAPWVPRSYHQAAMKGTKKLDQTLRSYEYGKCSTILHWNGKTFDKISIKPRKVTPDI